MLSKLIFDPLPTWALFTELILAGTIVILAGSRLTRLADVLARKLNLDSGWVGVILLATVTSLPELATGGTATWIGNVDLALGGIFGSCAFNITLIFLLNALWRRGSVLRGVSGSHALTSSFGIGLISLALIGVAVLDKFAQKPRLAAAGEIIWAVLLVVTYLGCVRLTYSFERNRKTARLPGDAGDKQAPETTLWFQVALMAVIIVGASWWLACLGDTLSTHEIELIGRPLGATFVGACFLALATSLPEIVTSVAAVRLGNLDLALGNIFGSNMFNIFVIPLLKVVSLINGEALLITGAAADTTQNLIVGLLAIILTTIAVGGLVYQSERRVLRHFGIDSILIVVTYAGGMCLLLIESG